MYYRPREKSRGPLGTFILFTLLLVMSGVLALLIGIYTGYFDVEVPTLASHFEPTPTPTRSPLLYVADGDAYFATGKLAEAIAAYEQAIQIDPDNDTPYIRQSRLLVYTRDTAKAVDRAAQAVVLNPTNPENLAYYCRALDWEARYEEAFDVCSCAIELAPTYAEGYAFLSEVYADLGDWRSARDTAQQALDTNFQSMDAQHNMGYALEIQGNYKEAIKYYENAITLAPYLAPLYIDAGRIYLDGLGDYEAAAQRFKTAIKLNPFDPEAYDRLGWTYYYNGEYVRAMDALEQSIGVDPTYVSINPRGSSAWGRLATVYYVRQNFEKAAEFFPKAIELAENEFLRRARRIEIYTEVQTLTGPEAIPILRGRFAASDEPGNLTYTADLKPVNYSAEVDLDTSRSCADLIAGSIQGEKIFLAATQSFTFTHLFSQTTGAAKLNPTTGNLLLDFKDLPQFGSNPYEIKMTFWPNRTQSVGLFQPENQPSGQINIQFPEKRPGPVEYYYQLGLSYVYMDPRQCDQAIPWLLKALEIDGSAYNPAWAGLKPGLCPSANSPPTPIPTFTPVPTPVGQ